MASVTDPDGVSWSVRRRLSMDWYGDASVDDYYFKRGLWKILDLVFVLVWPFWLLSRLAGKPWTIVIKRDGVEVAREKVSGWRDSDARVDRIARAAKAGKVVIKPRKSRPDIPPMADPTGLTGVKWLAADAAQRWERRGGSR